MSKRVLVEVPEDVWQRVRVRAAEEGRAVKDVVTNALRMYLSAGTEPASAAFDPRNKLAGEPPVHGAGRRELLETAPCFVETEPTTAEERKRHLDHATQFPQTIAELFRQVPGPVKTARQLLDEREARRGQEDGSQDPGGETDHD